ncbi:MAG: peptidoglycan DD-metalloendopeptidase family protein [Oscillatoriales cyanobacterium C42_A2020_001]|nr:peptidoglycan DD-metalloendopeptidase family protein [Leptolyngbyaceae cyanobacterium C42_A2020_001]
MAQGQLNAGSLGGRFLRRTIPQKGQPVPSRMNEHDAMTTQAKQASPEGTRRVRTSAAVIGLAVSVGAYSLPLPHQGDQAVAAEPSADSSASSASTSFETAAAFSPENADQGSVSGTEAAIPSVKHTVQEGQTLWDVARFYDTDASAIAAANGLSLNSVLRVGQVLVIPTDTRVAQIVASNDSSTTPGYYGPVSDWRSASEVANHPSSLPSSDGALKQKQVEAVQSLRQKRENLRTSLVAFGAQSPEPTVSVEIAPAAKSDETLPVPSVLPSANQNAIRQESRNSASGSQDVALRSSGEFAQPSELGSSAYRVSPGDTLGKIARTYGVSVKQLLEVNRISNPNYIFVGQTITIPQSQSAGLNQDRFKGAIAAVPTSTVVDAGSASFTQPRSSVVIPSTTTEKTKVSVATPFTASPQVTEESDSNSRLLRYNHVENLKLEIDRLRERYQSSGDSRAVAPVETKVAAVSVSDVSSPVAAVSEPVNPEFNPERYSTRMQSIRDRLKPAQSQTDTLPSLPSNAQQPQVVATAPLGSENYDPIKSRLGRTVSPELPPLGSGSEFLPGAPSSFEGYIWPTKGVLTSGYGWRWGRMHKGIDIAGPVGTPIVAAADGVVSYAGWNSGGYGYLVEIQHPDGSLTLYAHNNRILVQVGQEVAQGQQISEMGSTGYSTGPHLHFEVHPSGRGATNPMAYLPRS